MINLDITEEVLECIYEYNTSPNIDDIASDLCYDYITIANIVGYLRDINIVELDGEYITPIMDYYQAILLIESIED